MDCQYITRWTKIQPNQPNGLSVHNHTAELQPNNPDTTAPSGSPCGLRGHKATSNTNCHWARVYVRKRESWHIPWLLSLLQRRSRCVFFSWESDCDRITSRTARGGKASCFVAEWGKGTTTNKTHSHSHTHSSFSVDLSSCWLKIDDDEVMLNVLRCQLTY